MKPAFYNQVAAPQRYPALRPAVAIALGILLYTLYPNGNFWLHGTLLFIFWIVAFLVKKQRRRLSNIALMISFATWGFGAALYADIRQATNWIGHHLNNNAAYLAVVNDAIIPKNKTVKVPVQILALIDSTHHTPLTGKALIYVYKNTMLPKLNIGDTLLLPGKWQPIAAPGNPFAFDYRCYLSQQNIYHLQFIDYKQLQLLHHQQPPSWLHKMHENLVKRLAAHIKDKSTLGVMQAMLVGDDTNLDPTIQNVYAQTGIIHVIAISGGHIVFLFAMIAFFFKRWRHRYSKPIMYIVGVAVVWLYVLVAGAPPSAVRAAIMFSIIGAGVVLNKKALTLNSIFVSIALLLSIYPQWLFAVGFQLSVLAVVSITLFYKSIKQCLSLKRPLIRSLWSMVALSIAAEILVAPLVAYYFHIFPIHFIISNLIAWLFMSLAMMLGIALLLLSPMMVIANNVGLLLTFLLNTFNSIMTMVHSATPLFFKTLYVSLPELLWWYAAILLLTYGFLYYKHRNVQLGLLMIGLLIGFSIVEFLQQRQQHQLVLYQTPHSTHLSMIKGHTATQWHSQPQDSYFSYSIAPSYIAWGLNDTISVAYADTFFEVNNKIITLLTGNDYNNLGTCFKSDAIILGARPHSKTFQQVLQHFQPQNIYLTNCVTKGYKQLWKDSCAAHGITCIDVAESGAIVANY